MCAYKYLDVLFYKPIFKDEFVILFQKGSRHGRSKLGRVTAWPHAGFMKSLNPAYIRAAMQDLLSHAVQHMGCHEAGMDYNN